MLLWPTCLPSCYLRLRAAVTTPRGPIALAALANTVGPYGLSSAVVMQVRRNGRPRRRGGNLREICVCGGYEALSSLDLDPSPAVLPSGLMCRSSATGGSG